MLMSDYRYLIKISILPNETTIERLNDGSRRHVIVYPMPPSGNLYIALALTAYKKYICAWVEDVWDFYILRPWSLDDMHEKFDPKGSDDIVIYSHDENISGNLETQENEEITKRQPFPEKKQSK